MALFASSKPICCGHSRAPFPMEKGFGQRLGTSQQLASHGVLATHREVVARALIALGPCASSVAARVGHVLCCWAGLRLCICFCGTSHPGSLASLGIRSRRLEMGHWPSESAMLIDSTCSISGACCSSTRSAVGAVTMNTAAAKAWVPFAVGATSVGEAAGVAFTHERISVIHGDKSEHALAINASVAAIGGPGCVPGCA